MHRKGKTKRFEGTRLRNGRPVYRRNRFTNGTTDAKDLEKQRQQTMSISV